MDGTLIPEEIQLNLEHCEVNSVWKWIVTHDDSYVAVTMDRSRYDYITKFCEEMFGPEEGKTTYAYWSSGKMGWKFRMESHAKLMYDRWNLGV